MNDGKSKSKSKRQTFEMDKDAFVDWGIAVLSIKLFVMLPQRIKQKVV